MNKFNLALLFSILKQSKIQKFSFCFVPYSKFIFKILKKLKLGGFINGFNLSLNFLSSNLIYKNFIIYLKNTFNLVKFNYFLLSTRRKKFYLSFFFLQKILKKNPSFFFLFSTVKGVLTSKEILKNKVGGELICKII